MLGVFCIEPHGARAHFAALLDAVPLHDADGGLNTWRVSGINNRPSNVDLMAHVLCALGSNL
jgi:hypothetical protein